MMDAIRRSHLVYHAVTNFCGMTSSIYYAVNERSVGYFNMDRSIMWQYMEIRKRFIIVSNTEGSVFTEAMRQQTRTDPEILYLKTSRYQSKSIAGGMMEFKEAQNNLKEFLCKDARLYINSIS